MTDEAKPLFESADIISQYSRLRAIEDGVLVDISIPAIEAGFIYPVAMTRAAWEEAVAWTEEDSKRTGVSQDEKARLWDVLWVLRMRIKMSRNENPLPFQVLRVDRKGRARGPTYLPLKSICGPGDTAAPVVTILLPHED